MLEVDRSYQETDGILQRHVTLTAANATLSEQQAKCDREAASIE